MRVFKEVGLVLLGMLMMFTILIGMNLTRRVATLERNQAQIAALLNKIIQPQAKAPVNKQQVKPAVSAPASAPAAEATVK